MVGELAWRGEGVTRSGRKGAGWSASHHVEEYREGWGCLVGRAQTPDGLAGAVGVGGLAHG